MQADRIKSKIARAVVISAVATVIFITVITVAAELQAPLKDWLKATFSHHGVGKGILASVVFLGFSLFGYLAPLATSRAKIAKDLLVLFWSSLFGFLAILGFFVYEAVLKH